MNLPESVRTAVCAAVRPLQRSEFGLRWRTPEQVHLTLKFLGEVAPEREAELAAALGRAAAGTRPITLSLGEFGVFPDYRRPRVVWVGIAPQPALELLQHRVEQEFAPLGFPTEARAFRPHVTLARAAPRARSEGFAQLERALTQVPFATTALVETVDLMQSTLQREGAGYHVRASERLS